MVYHCFLSVVSFFLLCFWSPFLSYFLSFLLCFLFTSLLYFFLFYIFFIPSFHLLLVSFPSSHHSFLWVFFLRLSSFSPPLVLPVLVLFHFSLSFIYLFPSFMFFVSLPYFSSHIFFPTLFSVFPFYPCFFWYFYSLFSLFLLSSLPYLSSLFLLLDKVMNNLLNQISSDRNLRQLYLSGF